MRPRLRGVSHLAAAIMVVPLAPLWVVATDGMRPRLAIAAFAFGIAAMFSCSATLHLRHWSAGAYERLFRLDHSGIYLAIGGTGVAVGSLGLSGWPGRILVAASLVGAGLGILIEWLPFAPPRGFSNAVYLSFGWLPIVLLPWLWLRSGWLAVVLLLVGGVLYTSGAIIVGMRRPDPAPRWFGYHEIFHVLVIAAAAAHGTMVALLARGAARVG